MRAAEVLIYETVQRMVNIVANKVVENLEEVLIYTNQ